MNTQEIVSNMAEVTDNKVKKVFNKTVEFLKSGSVPSIIIMGLLAIVSIVILVSIIKVIYNY